MRPSDYGNWAVGVSGRTKNFVIRVLADDGGDDKLGEEWIGDGAEIFVPLTY